MRAASLNSPLSPVVPFTHVGILEIYIIQAILITRLYAVYGGSQLVIYGLLVLYMLGIVVGVIITVFATLPVKGK